jgi:alpha-mannosidase
VDWHENHTPLKAVFPLAATSNAATYEIPYGTIERPTTRNNSWEGAKFEVPAIRWADLGDGRHGFSLTNESKYGYDAKVNVLRLSLLRSPLAPDPDADRGPNHFSYALYPHAGDWKQALIVRRGYEYNYRLQAMQVAPHIGTLPPSHSFVNTCADNVVLITIKKAEDHDGLVLRFYDWAGKDTTVDWTVPKGVVAAHVVDLLEQPQGGSLPITNGDQIKVPVHPFEIQSVQLDYRVKQSFPSANLKEAQSSHRQAEAEPEGQVDR